MRQLLSIFFLIFVISISAPTFAAYSQSPLIDATLKSLILQTLNGPTDILKLVSQGKPVLVVPAYFSCNSTCPLMAQKIKEAYNNLSEKTKIEVVLLSFDTSDSVESIKMFKEHHELPQSWVLGVIKNEAAAKEFLNSVGFQFQKTKSGFDHPNSAFIFSAKMKKWSGILGGLDTSAQDLEKAIKDAEKFDNINFYDSFTRYIKQPEFLIYVGLAGLFISFLTIFAVLFGKNKKPLIPSPE